MKKIFIGVVVLAFLSNPLFARTKFAIGVSGDLSALWVRPLSVEADVRLDLTDELRVRVPVYYDRGLFRSFASFAISLDYSPFSPHTGIFLGIALVEFGFLFSKGTTPRFLFTNEIQIGFKQSFFSNYMFLEARLCIRDPTTAFSRSFDDLDYYLGGYERFKFRLNVGFNFEIRKSSPPKRQYRRKNNR